MKKEYCATSVPEGATNTDCLHATALKTALTTQTQTALATCASNCTSPPSGCSALTDQSDTGCASSYSNAVKSAYWVKLLLMGEIQCSCADPGNPDSVQEASGEMHVESSTNMLMVAVTMPFLTMAH